MTWQNPSSNTEDRFAHIHVCLDAPLTRMLHKQRFSCMFKSRNAKSNTCQVRCEQRRGCAVALSHMNHLQPIKYQDSPVRPGHGVDKYTYLSSTCFQFLPCYFCFSGDVKFHIGAKARFKRHPSNFCSQKEEELFIAPKCSLLISGYLMSKHWSEIVITAFVPSPCLWCLCICAL